MSTSIRILLFALLLTMIGVGLELTNGGANLGLVLFLVAFLIGLIGLFARQEPQHPA